MRPQRSVTQRDAAALFDQAVRERALAVLTLQEHGDWQTFKARFLERDPNRRFFVLDYQPNHGETPPEVVAGQCVGVSFRDHSRKILFASVVEAKGHYVLDDRTSIPAIRYRWPRSITELQRRSYYRTPVPESLSLVATLWPGGPETRSAAQNTPLQLVSGTLADISCGGALVRLNQPSPPDWADRQTLGVELQLGDGRSPLVTSATFRGVRHDELEQYNTAIQFVGLELSVEGRLVLQRLAACVQRFHRMAVSSGPRRWERPRGHGE